MPKLCPVASVRAFVVALAMVAAAELAIAQNDAAQPCKSTVVGTVENFELPSKVFDFTRTARVFLPPGYGDPVNRERTYPVLYMLDGQNLFDA